MLVYWCLLSLPVKLSNDISGIVIQELHCLKVQKLGHVCFDVTLVVQQRDKRTRCGRGIKGSCLTTLVKI